MPVYRPDRVLISLDEFPAIFAPSVFLHALRRLSPIFTELSSKQFRSGQGGVVVRHSAPVPGAMRLDVEAAIAAHDPASRGESPERGLGELPQKRPGRATYHRSAPKQGEAIDAGTGTMIYIDHDGAWRRVSDDLILKAAP